MSGATKRFQFRSSDTMGAPNLNRPLNDFALDVHARLEALETLAGVLRVLDPFIIVTGASVAQNTLPFPIAIATPDFTPSAVIVAKVENLTTPAVVGTTAHTAQYRILDGRIDLQLVTGLAANTRYKLTLVAMK